MEQLNRAQLIAQTVDGLTRAFLTGIPEEEQPRFEAAYREYLEKSYPMLREVPEEELPYALQACEEMEQITMISAGRNEKEAALFPDPNYRMLESLGAEILQLAREKLRGKSVTPRRTYEEYREQVNQLDSEITPLFRAAADGLRSEILLDLEYLFHDSSNLSFRLSRDLPGA